MGLGYAGYIGILFESGYYNGETWYNQGGFDLKSIGRLIVVACIALPFGIPVLFLSSASDLSVYVQLVFFILLPCLGIGFCVFAFSDKVNSWLGLNETMPRKKLGGSDEERDLLIVILK